MRDIVDAIIEMSITRLRPLSPLPPAPCVSDDEEETPSSEVVGLLIEDLIWTASLDSQKDYNQICNEVRSQNNTTSPHFLEEGNSESCGGPEKVCQNILLSLMAEVVKEPKIICKELLSELVESIVIKKLKIRNKETTGVTRRILKALDNLYK